MKVVFLYRDDFIQLFDSAINSGVFAENEVVRVYNSFNQKGKSTAKIGKQYIIEEYKNKTPNLRLHIDTIDSEITNLTQGEYNVWKVISNDRFLEKANPSYATELLALYYNFWDELMQQENPDFIVNELMSLMFTHIPEIVGRKYEVGYLGFLQSALYAHRFMFVHGDKGDARRIRYEYENYIPTNDEIAEARIFLDNFVNKRSVSPLEGSLSQGAWGKLKQVKKRIFSNRLHRAFFNDGFDYINAGIRKMWLRYQIGLHRATWKHWNKYEQISFKNDIFEDNIEYFYPLHVEPEGLVIYWTGGRHKKQLYTSFEILKVFKLDKLFLKDHVSSFGYRTVNDYKIWNNTKGIVLIDNKIPAVNIMKKCKCVFSISGTTGMEAFLLGKHVVALAQSHYSFVRSILYVPELNKASADELQAYLSVPQDIDDSDKIQYLLAFYQGTYDCKIEHWNMQPEEGRKFAIAIQKEIVWNQTVMKEKQDF